MEEARYLTGRFLLAMPGIGDPRFDRAVIAMCARDAEGAVGIGVGQVHDGVGFHQLLDQFDIAPGVASDAPVYVGGPVEPRRGFVLHSRDWEGQGTIDVASRWSLSGTLDVLRAIADGSGPADWLVALGYAGWRAGQLDGELVRHGLFIAEGDTNLLFAGTAEERWWRAFGSVGIDPRLLAMASGRA